MTIVQAIIPEAKATFLFKFSIKNFVSRLSPSSFTKLWLFEQLQRICCKRIFTSDESLLKTPTFQASLINLLLKVFLQY